MEREEAAAAVRSRHTTSRPVPRTRRVPRDSLTRTRNDAPQSSSRTVAKEKETERERERGVRTGMYQTCRKKTEHTLKRKLWRMQRERVRIDRSEIKAACIRERSEIRNRRRGWKTRGGGLSASGARKEPISFTLSSRGRFRFARASRSAAFLFG